MKLHDLKLIESKIEQSNDYEGEFHCHECGKFKAPSGNKCGVCYMLDIKDAMSPEEFEAYENKHFTGVEFK